MKRLLIMFQDNKCVVSTDSVHILKVQISEMLILGQGEMDENRSKHRKKSKVK